MTHGHNQNAETGEKSKMTVTENPVGLNGMEFIEYASKNPDELEALFGRLGFQKTGSHKKKNVSLFSQGNCYFIINREKNSFADTFSGQHGPSVCATGFRVQNAKAAYETAVARGAKPCTDPAHHSFPAVYGIGDSVIYFIEKEKESGPLDFFANDFEILMKEPVTGVGLLRIDHLTNNVPKGEMQRWCDFYEKIFNFREVRYFDIKGKATGLYSKVMRSPCNKIIIPINEPTGEKSQIQEYLDEYRGSGIQHIALSTTDIISTIENLRKNGVEFLDTVETYYDLLSQRLPNVTEDIDRLKGLRILADGDHDGYLLQIFTKTVIGPIFYEIIQRKNHNGFGEGNFQALFDAIEEDQRRRGYL